ncbi:double zinc ribbon domain-containing protein [Haloarcula onubensis]|uniref:Zinc ribbon domain-containing protein n=1 Tax=Haloarcula onubensis TaxID=2950539 RepID=A0ABU2FJI3_9EURY|nr:zinc ribbon domain-containing protein [Halomicroarcula sp. S3CR25-11]MDS0280921.1 zinc ribbon domain-containing protein [Halomicroarcula sp. S3CR25-11]
MSKITFRADDDLVDRLEEFDASKSQVMREALRAYLDGETETASDADEPVTDTESIDALIADRVDALIADRLGPQTPTRQPRDVNVNITLDADSGSVTEEQADDTRASDTASAGEATGVSHDHEGRKTAPEGRENTDAGSQSACAQCGENLASSHVYCPNCGEKASRRVFCDCGDELRSDWGFCPGCGRRTPAADVLEQSRSGANRE